MKHRVVNVKKKKEINHDPSKDFQHQDIAIEEDQLPGHVLEFGLVVSSEDLKYCIFPSKALIATSSLHYLNLIHEMEFIVR